MIGLALACLATAGAAAAQDMSDLSLEELLEREVTSVAKRPQRIADAPAAVFLITQDDIRRSGARSIDELLRMVPGMEVATVSPDGSAVSARGFNNRYANKLLVLMDGRAVYVSTLSGVLWDQQLTRLEDIQRIEVVRGPGATLWGANAVNGVINIVTKHAVDSLGAGMSAWRDDEGASRASGRIGLRIGEDGALRLSVNEVRRRGKAVDLGQIIEERTEGRQLGFRYDVEPSDHDSFTLQGEAQDGSGEEVQSLDRSDYRNHNILARWSRRTADGEGWSLQTYWDHGVRESFGLRGKKDQFDLDFTRYVTMGRHSLVFGAGYRRAQDHVRGGLLDFSPDSFRETWRGAYLQDDVAVSPRLTVSLGAKVEENAFTGVEWQPSVRAIWKDPAGWSAWGAVSRAVRTPSRLETALVFDQRPALYLVENPDLVSEVMIAYEIGWRGQLSRRVSADVTAYHQVYDSLIGNFLSLTASGPMLRFENRGQARTTGLEAALDAHISPVWMVKVAASRGRMSAESLGVNTGVGSNYDPDMMPAGQISLRSNYDLSDAVDVDVWLRRVEAIGSGAFAVKAYDDLDVRLAWRATSRLELFMRGENLMRASRVEFREQAGSPVALVDRRIAIGFELRR